MLLIQRAALRLFRCYKNRHFVCEVPGEGKKKRQTLCLMPIMVASGTEVGIRPSLSSCWMPLIRWLASALQWAHWKVFDNPWMKAAARLLQQSLANRKPFLFFFFFYCLKKDRDRLRKNSSKMGSIFPKILKMSNDSWAGGTYSPYCLCYCIHQNKAKQNKMKTSKPCTVHLLRTHHP